MILFWEVGRKGTAAPGEAWEERRRRAAHAAMEERKRAQQLTADVVPIVEALQGGDPNMQVSAIEALRDVDPKRVVALLERERDNQSYDVRFRAAESLGRIATRHLDAIGEAERRLAERPDSETQRRLARLCFEYADLKLDSARVNRDFFERAIGHAERVLAIRFDPDMAVLIARTHARLEDREAAESRLREALARAPGNTDGLLLLAELQFQRKDFHALGETCSRLRAGGQVTDSATLAFLAHWSAEDTIMEQF
jgi:hypothetical protein